MYLSTTHGLVRKAFEETKTPRPLALVEVESRRQRGGVSALRNQRVNGQTSDTVEAHRRRARAYPSWPSIPSYCTGFPVTTALAATSFRPKSFV